MLVTDTYGRVALDAVKVARNDRQRKGLFNKNGEFINSDGLVDSIRLRGVLNPIIVDRDFNLIAGERRLTASKLAGMKDIPYRFVEDCDELEVQIIEAEENLKRLDLDWKDEAQAIAGIHSLYKLRHDEGWSQEETSRELGYATNSKVMMCIRVVRELNNERIAAAENLRAAYNMLARQDERKIADAMNDIVEGTHEIFTHGSSQTADPTLNAIADSLGVVVVTPTGVSAVPKLAPESILHGDFLEWSKTYSGPRFNFLHCDFPYGVEVFAGPQSGVTRWEQTYADGKDVYVELIRALGASLDRLLTPSAHVVFWLSASIVRQYETLELFRQVAPSLAFQDFPLVWHKTCNTGILPDPKRGPRRVYETALIASREDRYIVRAVSNCYGAPVAKALHPSTKPEPVLRHFFSMFVDENTRMLDPTCGSGSALRAAESLNAEHVLGIERDEEFVKSARVALRQFRTMRQASHG